MSVTPNAGPPEFYRFVSGTEISNALRYTELAPGAWRQGNDRVRGVSEPKVQKQGRSSPGNKSN